MTLTPSKEFSNFLLRKLPCEFKLVDIAQISNGHISGLLQGKVTCSGKLVVLYVLRMLIWPWPDQRSRSRSLSFWSSENCTFLCLSLPYRHRAQNWWLTTIVWHLVYSFLEPHFWISPPVGGHMTSKFAKCWYPWVSSPHCLRLEACDCDCK